MKEVDTEIAHKLGEFYKISIISRIRHSTSEKVSDT